MVILDSLMKEIEDFHIHTNKKRVALKKRNPSIYPKTVLLNTGSIFFNLLILGG